jgi:hypothetical protein
MDNLKGIFTILNEFEEKISKCDTENIDNGSIDTELLELQNKIRIVKSSIRHVYKHKKRELENAPPITLNRMIIDISDSSESEEESKKLITPNKPLIKNPNKNIKTHDIEIYPDTMYLAYLHEDDPKIYIKNIDKFRNIKFYYRSISTYNGLYKYNKGSYTYYIADNNILYMLNKKNELVRGRYNELFQHWTPLE